MEQKIIASNQQPCVYFAKNEISNLIKIGKTTDLKGRINTLSTYCPFGVTLIGYINTRLYTEIESNLHLKFNNYRKNGEWFDVSFSDIKRYINTELPILINGIVKYEIETAAMFGLIDIKHRDLSHDAIRHHWEITQNTTFDILKVNINIKSPVPRSNIAYVKYLHSLSDS